MLFWFVKIAFHATLTQHALMQAQLLKGSANKVPKVVAACLFTIREGLKYALLYIWPNANLSL